MLQKSIISKQFLKKKIHKLTRNLQVTCQSTGTINYRSNNFFAHSHTQLQLLAAVPAAGAARSEQSARQPADRAGRRRRADGRGGRALLVLVQETVNICAARSDRTHTNSNQKQMGGGG